MAGGVAARPDRSTYPSQGQRMRDSRYLRGRRCGGVLGLRAPRLLAATAVLLLAGCAASEVRFVSYFDPYFPETYELAFDEVAYWQGPTGDLHIVAVRVPQGRRPAAPREEPAASEARGGDEGGTGGGSGEQSVDAATPPEELAEDGAPPAIAALGWPPARDVAHYLSVRMFWRPQPGRTPANSTTMNVILRYVVAGPEGTLVYTGTGFAYPKGDAGETLRVALESGRLQLESRHGAMRDGLGNSRVTGKLIARHDRAEAASWLREAELKAGE